MIYKVKNQNELSGIYVVYSGSCLVEDETNFGVSHLIEHLLCKNVEHLQEEFDKFGISFNAYTSNSEVVFYLTGLEEYLQKYVIDFIKLIPKFEFSEQIIESEKRIVLEEYEDTFNEQTSNHYHNFFREHFNFYSPIGKKSCIKNQNFNSLKDFFDKNYKEPTKIILVSKNLEDYDKLSNFSTTEVEYKFEPIPDNKSLEFENSSEYGKCSIFWSTKIITEDLYKLTLISDILGFGLLSPLSKIIREEKGLTYNVQCFSNAISDNQGCLCIQFTTNKDNTDIAVKTLKDIINDYESYFTKERYDLVIENTKIREKVSSIYKHTDCQKYISSKNWNWKEYENELTFESLLDYFKNNIINNNIIQIK